MKCQRPECQKETKTKYCSRSCAAIVNNAKNPKRRPQGACKTCNEPVSTSRVYCSKECQPSKKRIICKKCDEPVVSKQLCRAHYNEHMAKYMTERYHRRRNDFIKSRGGVCEQCSETENLEIDHIDPEEKSFPVGVALSGWAESRVQKELAKCQVLCKACHAEKTRKDLAKRFNQREHWEHGTVTGRKYCDCELCKKAQSEYMRQWREKKKASR